MSDAAYEEKRARREDERSAREDGLRDLAEDIQILMQRSAARLDVDIAKLVSSRVRGVVTRLSPAAAYTQAHGIVAQPPVEENVDQQHSEDNQQQSDNETANQPHTVPRRSAPKPANKKSRRWKASSGSEGSGASDNDEDKDRDGGSLIPQQSSVEYRFTGFDET